MSEGLRIVNDIIREAQRQYDATKVRVPLQPGSVLVAMRVLADEVARTCARDKDAVAAYRDFVDVKIAFGRPGQSADCILCDGPLDKNGAGWHCSTCWMRIGYETVTGSNIQLVAAPPVGPMGPNPTAPSDSAPPAQSDSAAPE